MSDEYTLVQLAWRKRRRNHRILFGAPVRQVRLDWQRSFAVFKPGDIFAYERWEANKFGTQHWSIHVLEATDPGSSISTVCGVKPGAVILASRIGKSGSISLLNIFDGLREVKFLHAVTSTQWRLIGHKLQTGKSPESILDAFECVT